MQQFSCQYIYVLLYAAYEGVNEDYIWSTPTKSGQRRWEDQQVTGENTTQGSCHHITAHSQFWPTKDFKTHFKLQSLFWLKQCKSFQLHFLEMATLLSPYFSLRDHNFTYAQFLLPWYDLCGRLHAKNQLSIYAVLKLINVKWKLDRTFCLYQSHRMTKLTHCYPFVRAGHIIIWRIQTFTQKMACSHRHSGACTPTSTRIISDNLS